MDETPGARSARIYKESLAQDAADTALAQAALDRLMPSGAHENEAKCFIIGYKNALRDARAGRHQ